MAIPRDTFIIGTGLCILLTILPIAASSAPPAELIRESPTDTTTTPSVPVHLELSGGMVQHFWEPGLSSNLVDFETEGLKAWWAEVGVRIGGIPFLLYRADRPFQSSPQQEEMLQASHYKESSYEEYVAFLDLLPLTSSFMKEKRGFAGILRALASTRLIYSRNLFFGHTSSKVDFVYFPMDVQIDRSVDPPVVNGHIEFQADQPLNFKTEFYDFHVMVPVMHQKNDKNQEKILRFGYFHSRWEKPSESVYASFEGAPILQDTRLETRGISGSFEQGLYDPGLGLRVDSDWGILGSDFTSAIDQDFYLKEDEGINYISFSGELRYNFPLLRDSNLLWATIAARGQFRYWRVMRAVRNNEGEVVETKPVRELDRDKLYQVFATIKLRF